MWGGVTPREVSELVQQQPGEKVEAASLLMLPQLLVPSLSVKDEGRPLHPVPQLCPQQPFLRGGAKRGQVGVCFHGLLSSYYREPVSAVYDRLTPSSLG